MGLSRGFTSILFSQECKQSMLVYRDGREAVQRLLLYLLVLQNSSVYREGLRVYCSVECKQSMLVYRDGMQRLLIYLVGLQNSSVYREGLQVYSSVKRVNTVC